MSDSDADDEFSIDDNDDILTGIVKYTNFCNPSLTKFSRFEDIRTKKIIKAENNLLNAIHKDWVPFSKRNKLNPRYLWKSACKKVKKLDDPWRFIINSNFEKEKVERYCFNSLNNRWETPTTCIVKMEDKPFSFGAMRECYRLKKMASILRDHKSWINASNYVAKKYINPVEEHVYFDDVKLQMDAKLWGQEYSRQEGVIKKVDICQMSVIRFLDRPNQPLYHLEHFIEGDYVKYNSNSGYVDEFTRNTPQAFSHYTFERSGHKLIVVDIQGVGDIYTDPQIHTIYKVDYGDGNLGTRGMALFFYSHVCNPICRTLGLKPFDLSLSEKKRLCFNHNVKMHGTVANKSRLLKIRSLSEENIANGLNYKLDADQSATSEEYLDNLIRNENSEFGDDEASDKGLSIQLTGRRSHDSSILENEESMQQYFENGLITDLTVDEKNKLSKEQILAEIHHELSKIHSSGKLVKSDFLSETGDLCSAIDWVAFLFHEDLSASFGYLEAVINMAHFYMNLPTDSLFDNCPIKASDNDRSKGLELMKKAGDCGDRRCMVFLGTYYTSLLESEAVYDPEYVNAAKAAYQWYERALKSVGQVDISGCYDSLNEIADYELIGHMAKLLSEGGPGLKKDVNYACELYGVAGEKAMNVGKGKIATKYFSLSDSLQ